MGMTDTYCKAFVVELDTIIITMTGIESALTAPILALIELLDNLQGQIPTPQGDIRNGIADIQSGIRDATPTWEGIDQFQNMLSQCGLLEEKIMDQSPISLITGLVGAVGDTIVGVIDDITDTLSALIEMPAAIAIKKINDLIEGLGIGDMLSRLDKLVACLDSICPSYNVGTKLDIILEKIETVHLNESGTLDLGTLYSDAGLSAPQISNITLCIDEITSAANDAASKASKAGASVANAVKKLF